MFFKIENNDSKSNARAGTVFTDHGEIETPVFMPVGTAGSVKAVHFNELISVVNAQIILANTYHLFLRPGTEVIQSAGGLHSFINWNRPILTDSGGYQVYSISDKRKISENGVTFHSHIDGSIHTFTPEKVIEIQRIIGADIIMAFDECTPYPCDYEYAKSSLNTTHNWLIKCKEHFNKTKSIYSHKQFLFPIVQGSTYKDLRIKSAEFISGLDLQANAIGGLSVGEPEENLYEIIDLVCQILPKEKPRYLMGVGNPVNLLECIALGIDMFDCVMPTRNGRNGMLFTSQGVINIKNEKWKFDFSPIDSELNFFDGHTYTKSYLRHLILSQEYLANQIASLHNLGFYGWLMREARKEILNGSFSEWKKRILPIISRRL